MPHLYLHQRNEDRFVEDPEGKDYPNLEAAVEDAIVAARQMMAERVRNGAKPDGWRFEITTGNGQILAVVPFQETLSDDGELDPGRTAKWYRVDAI